MPSKRNKKKTLNAKCRLNSQRILCRGFATINYQNKQIKLLNFLFIFFYNPVEIVTKLITGWSELDTERSDF